MRLLLHTMATPELTPLEALEMARSLGLDGIDLICQAGYRSAIAPDAGIDEARQLAQAAAALGLEIAALTPYEKRISSADPAERAAGIAALVHAIDLAEGLGAESLRILAGDAVADAMWSAAVGRIVPSLQVLAGYAAPKGLKINIENHGGTLADTAARTAQLWRLVDREAVGIIYDPGNLMRDGKEHLPASFDLQHSAIRLVHVKDYSFRVPTRLQPSTEETRTSVPVGEGDVPWNDIVRLLASTDYRGDFVFEYEMRWVPEDLPPTKVGVAGSRDYLTTLLRRYYPA